LWWTADVDKDKRKEALERDGQDCVWCGSTSNLHRQLPSIVFCLRVRLER
jgi:hypothetical protein